MKPPEEMTGMSFTGSVLKYSTAGLPEGVLQETVGTGPHWPPRSARVRNEVSQLYCSFWILEKLYLLLGSKKQ